MMRGFSACKKAITLGLMALVAMLGVTSVFAQTTVTGDLGTIEGDIELTATDATVLDILTREGFRTTSPYGSVSASSLGGGGFSATGIVSAANAAGTVAPYTLKAQSGEPYRVSATMYPDRGNRDVYRFVSQDTSAILPSNGTLNLDFAECPGIIRLSFRQYDGVDDTVYIGFGDVEMAPAGSTILDIRGGQLTFNGQDISTTPVKYINNQAQVNLENSQAGNPPETEYAVVRGDLRWEMNGMISYLQPTGFGLPNEGTVVSVPVNVVTGDLPNTDDISGRVAPCNQVISMNIPLSAAVTGCLEGDYDLLQISNEYMGPERGLAFAYDSTYGTSDTSWALDQYSPRTGYFMMDGLLPNSDYDTIGVYSYVDGPDGFNFNITPDATNAIGNVWIPVAPPCADIEDTLVADVALVTGDVILRDPFVQNNPVALRSLLEHIKYGPNVRYGQGSWVEANGRSPLSTDPSTYPMQTISGAGGLSRGVPEPVVGFEDLSVRSQGYSIADYNNYLPGIRTRDNDYPNPSNPVRWDNERLHLQVISSPSDATGYINSTIDYTKSNQTSPSFLVDPPNGALNFVRDFDICFGTLNVVVEETNGIPFWNPTLTYTGTTIYDDLDPAASVRAVSRGLPLNSSDASPVGEVQAILPEGMYSIDPRLYTSSGTSTIPSLDNIPIFCGTQTTCTPELCIFVFADGGCFEGDGPFTIMGGVVKADSVDDVHNIFFTLDGDPTEYSVGPLDANDEFTFTVEGPGGTNPSYPNLNVGINMITVTAQVYELDQFGNPTTTVAGQAYTQVPITIDNEAPVIDCPEEIQIVSTNDCEDGTELYEVNLDDLGITVSDDTGIAEVNFSPAVVGVGTHTITVTAVDTCGKETSCQFVITVEPQDPISIECPEDITIQVNQTQDCAAQVFWDTPVTYPAADDPFFGSLVATTTDEFGNVYEVNSGDVFALGTHVITYTLTDICGRETTCSFTITVEKPDAPTATCSSDITLFSSELPLYDYDQCDHRVTWNLPAVTGVGTEITCQPTSGTLFPAVCGDDAATPVVCTVTDVCGQTTQCGFDVKVIDDEGPQFIDCSATEITISEDTPPGPIRPPIKEKKPIKDNIGVIGNVTYGGTGSVDMENEKKKKPIKDIIIIDNPHPGPIHLPTPPVSGTDITLPCKDGGAWAVISTKVNPSDCNGPVTVDKIVPDDVLVSSSSSWTDSDGVMHFRFRAFFPPCKRSEITWVAKDACGNESTCDVSVTVGSCEMGRTIGFWSSNLRKNLDGDNGAQISSSDLVAALEEICSESNIAEFQGLCDIDPMVTLQNAYDMIAAASLESSSMYEKLLGQLLANWLNGVTGITPFETLLTPEVTVDPVNGTPSGGVLYTVEDFIIWAEEVLNADAAEYYEQAKDIADGANNGMGFECNQ